MNIEYDNAQNIEQAFSNKWFRACSQILTFYTKCNAIIQNQCLSN